MTARLSFVLVILAMVALGFTGCATIQSTTATEIARGPGHRIWAEDTGHGFFMVSLPPLDAIAKLKAQCAGNITGVQTTTSMRNWFLIVQHYNQLVMGWCQTN